MTKNSNLTVRVGRNEMTGFLTCPICKNFFEDPMNITECLHIFCNNCICDKITEEDLSNCPVCDIYLGCSPLDKLRPDHNWNSVRSAIVPSLRKEEDDYVFVEKEGKELEFVSEEAEQSEVPSFPMPARRKERSLSSMVSTLKVSNHTVITTRTKSNVRKLLPSHESSIFLEKLHISAEDHPEGSNFSTTPIKIAQNHKQNSSAVESSKQQVLTKDTERTQGKPLEGMNDLLKPLKYLAKAVDITRSDKSTSEGLFSKAMNASKGKDNDAGNKSRIYDDADNAVGSTPPSVQVKAKRMTRGRPRKARAPEELNIPAQAIIDAARNQHVERVNPVWISLVSSDNQEGDAPLPQLRRCYLMIKNVKLPVLFIKKYLVQKLDLDSEDEVEISLWGEPLLPSLHLQTLIELWSQTTTKPERLSAMVGRFGQGFCGGYFLCSKSSTINLDLYLSSKNLILISSQLLIVQ